MDLHEITQSINNIEMTQLLPFHNSSSFDHESAVPVPQALVPSIDRERSSMEAMREMIFRMAMMQPIHIDPESVKPPKRKNVKISKDPQSVAARHRREKISERIRILQRLVPGGTKMDTASMLDEAVHYVKFLKKQLKSLEQAANNNRPIVTGFNHWPVDYYSRSLMSSNVQISRIEGLNKSTSKRLKRPGPSQKACRVASCITGFGRELNGNQWSDLRRTQSKLDSSNGLRRLSLSGCSVEFHDWMVDFKVEFVLVGYIVELEDLYEGNLLLD
ncbi:hypothetical protein HAX54_016559 [Datura stramonium]|uniref:BHLH domain-containing protein n=1 Tax=Datura stramonium TaxID=4076 RepID=A0ABS8UJ07_DATST|nr:hypothetical protein [Datura stramonium]